MLSFEASSHSPIWNAAGTLGYAPPRHGPMTSALGAFVTNPISWGPRTPAQLPRLLNYPGGVVLHTGLPNPGLRQVLRQFSRQWAQASLPVIVHLVAESPENVNRMVRQLEEVEGVAGVELGLPPDARPAQVTELIQAGIGELPLIVRLPLAGVPPSAPLPDVVSLAPPRGTLPGVETGSFLEGRLFGPGLFPQTLRAVRAWKEFGIPIIAGGGVYHPTQAEALLAVGASAVQLDLRLWREPWPDERWESWLETRLGT
jgi:dihydroorotate dehydrogenase (NAD+) catalytic subunit